MSFEYLKIHPQHCQCPFCGVERNEKVFASKSSDEIISRIQNYLGNGGLFNPEMMEHDKVRELLMDCRNHIRMIKFQNEDLTEALHQIKNKQAIKKLGNDLSQL